ncbi:MAG TPA: tetraacyldisaccharide 4'-kinase [bacterium]
MMGSCFHDAWWRLATERRPRTLLERLICGLLRIGSWIFLAASSARNAAFDLGIIRPVRLPCPVVSVGNLTVGGTGKTSCVELIARKLLARGRRVAVLSRGYGGGAGSYWLRWEGGRLAVGGRSGADGALADEPQLLAARLPGVPVLVGADRVRSARAALAEFGADALVLDDGFQHRRIARDCDLVLIHAGMPFDGWALLPRGPMREPLAALGRAHLIIITKAEGALERVSALGERLRAIHPGAELLSAEHRPVKLTDPVRGAALGLEALSGRRVALVSSIGDPAGFETTLARLHAQVAWHQAFPDHHRYRSGEWDALTSRLRAGGAEALVTTEKDWVRLAPVAAGEAPVPVWVLAVALTLIDGEDVLDARLACLFDR